MGHPALQLPLSIDRFGQPRRRAESLAYSQEQVAAKWELHARFGYLNLCCMRMQLSTMSFKVMFSCQGRDFVRRLMFAVTVAALLVPAGVRAQLNSQGGIPAEVTVRGVVLSTVDQKPIPGAAVQLSAAQPMVMTDEQGRFEFRDVPLGRNAEIMTQKEGFLCPVLHVPVPPNCMRWIDLIVHEAAQQGKGDAVPGAVVDGDVVNLTLTLLPAAQVVGRVVDQDGAPVTNLTVALMARELRDGRYVWSPVGRAVKKTDAWGAFHMDGLEPGSYQLRSGARMMSSSPFSKANPAVWYPNASNGQDATPFDLAPGAQKEADLTVPSVRFHLINIPYTWDRSDAIGTVAYGLSSGQPIDSFVVVPPSNQHVFQAYVPNGTYTFSVMVDPPAGPQLQRGAWEDGSQAPYSGFEEFTVDDQTISAPPVGLQRPVDIAVHVEATLTQQEKSRAAAGRSEMNRPPMVSFGLSGGGGYKPAHRITWVAPNPNASFALKPEPLVFQAVPSGEYTVHASGMQGSYVASLTCGGTNLLREPLVVGASHPACVIEAVVRDDTATLGVNVLASARARMEAAQVKATTLVLIPIEREQEQPQSQPIWLQGGAQSVTLAPGKYLVVFTDGRTLAWRDPNVRKRLEALGQTVALAPGASQSVALDWSAELNDPAVKQPGPRLGLAGPQVGLFQQ
jgi:hypothetical protein